jgi:hypothetical protein
VKHLPDPKSWRRKAVAGLVVLALLPVLPAVLLVAASQVVGVVEHVASVVWPWVGAVVVLVVLGRLVMRR